MSFVQLLEDTVFTARDIGIRNRPYSGEVLEFLVVRFRNNSIFIKNNGILLSNVHKYH